VLEAVIAERRSIKQFLPSPVPRSLITRLLDLAVWAPNHRLTEPWRFYVLDGSACARLGEIAREVTRAKVGASASDPGLVERKSAEAAASWAAVPALIYVTVVTDPRPEVDRENYGAVCCAVQNLLLAAHAAGLGASWSSGAVAGAPALQHLVGAAATERVVGLIRVGYADPRAAMGTSQRAPSAHYTTWVDDG
jgi:nitroreductase